MAKHYNIPLFFPETACPFRCIYCNQANISGQKQLPDDQQIIQTINKHLASFPEQDRRIEVAFFGGSFTGMPPERQRHYLDLISPFIAGGMVDGIRISTRPDFISKEILDLLTLYPVSAIELGAQSLDDEVLKKSGRGHTAQQVVAASALILERNIGLGLQMMTGLPADTPEKALATARKIIDAGVQETRIYPCVVIKNTPLELLFLKGHYKPQSLDEAVELAAELYQIFHRAKLKVLRTGLHPSEELNRGNYIAGPYHPSFTELVMSRIWKGLIVDNPNFKPGKKIELLVPPHQLNHAIGYWATNKKALLKHYRQVRFKAEPSLPDFTYHFIVEP